MTDIASHPYTVPIGGGSVKRRCYIFISAILPIVNLTLVKRLMDVGGEA